MIEIGRENQFYGFAHEGMQACCTARDGDVLRFHTQDCYGDLLTREDIRRADIGDRAPKFNPTTGPVYIEGANPGDTLAVGTDLPYASLLQFGGVTAPGSAVPGATVPPRPFVFLTDQQVYDAIEMLQEYLFDEGPRRG